MPTSLTNIRKMRVFQELPILPWILPALPPPPWGFFFILFSIPETRRVWHLLRRAVIYYLILCRRVPLPPTYRRSRASRKRQREKSLFFYFRSYKSDLRTAYVPMYGTMATTSFKFNKEPTTAKANERMFRASYRWKFSVNTVYYYRVKGMPVQTDFQR